MKGERSDLAPEGPDSVGEPFDRHRAMQSLAGARRALEAARTEGWGQMAESRSESFPPAVGSLGDLVDCRAVVDVDGGRVMVTAWDEATQQATTAELGLEAAWRLAASMLEAVMWGVHGVESPTPPRCGSTEERLVG